jgi:galactose mutarotase-like enzyme
MFLKLDRIGNIEGWRMDGKSILALPSAAKPIRGGSFATFPVHGSVPSNISAWSGITIPKHGFLRSGDELSVMQRTERYPGSNEFLFKHVRTANYPWAFDATLGVMGGSSGITYSLLARRSKNCGYDIRMPFSMGLHPYFAVVDSMFLININNKETLLSANYVESTAMTYPLDSWSEVKLISGDRTIKITTAGADELIVWSDNPAAYICIEPVFGRLTSKYLYPDEFHQLLSRIEVKFEKIT